MIAAGLALIVLGVLLMFLLGWFGIVVGIVGLILLVLFLFGVGRGVAESQP
jgi:hypothetical protein